MSARLAEPLGKVLVRKVPVRVNSDRLSGYFLEKFLADPTQNDTEYPSDWPMKSRQRRRLNCHVGDPANYGKLA